MLCLCLQCVPTYLVQTIFYLYFSFYSTLSCFLMHVCSCCCLYLRYVYLYVSFEPYTCRILNGYFEPRRYQTVGTHTSSHHAHDSENILIYSHIHSNTYVCMLWWWITGPGCTGGREYIANIINNTNQYSERGKALLMLNIVRRRCWSLLVACCCCHLFCECICLRLLA